jgi:hypothetical protein
MSAILTYVGTATVQSDWVLALEDADLDGSECLLVLLDRGSSDGGGDAMLLDPGFEAVDTVEEPLTAVQLTELNSARWRDGYRVLMARIDNRAERLGLLRDALEHARQHKADRDVYRLGGQLSDAIGAVYGSGRGGAAVLRMHPLWADAAARGAALARKYAEPDITPQVLWGVHGSLLRTNWAAGDPSTLPERLLVWAALHREAVETQAEFCGGIETVAGTYRPELAPKWQLLMRDPDLELLGRAAKLSRPNAAQIEAAAEYPAAVWDRVLDLLDRGMARGQQLLSTNRRETS